MKAHVCIGGPLDGEFATSQDFWTHLGGMYAHLKDEYVQFNNAHRPYGKTRKRAQVAWLHTELLKPSISPRQR